MKTNKGKPPVNLENRLYRSGKDKILGGVCGGIAEYLKIDPVIVRFVWILSIFVYGIGVWLYIIMWIIMPRNPNHKWKD
ncbi:MAG: PspC domain-containing protein [Candidatus Aenigmarchaeota archaeon]|nr:PspC domain-containing protein [Candidatus Aenigmarchaeota archaeon]